VPAPAQREAPVRAARGRVRPAGSNGVCRTPPAAAAAAAPPCCGVSAATCEGCTGYSWSSRERSWSRGPSLSKGKALLLLPATATATEPSGCCLSFRCGCCSAGGRACWCLCACCCPAAGASGSSPEVAGSRSARWRCRFAAAGLPATLSAEASADLGRLRFKAVASSCAACIMRTCREEQALHVRHVLLLLLLPLP
jgi:hypothetical protein